MIELSDKTKRFIDEHITDDVFALGFQAARYPDVDMHAAILQIEGRQKAKEKLPTWYAHENIVYPPHLSLEQCSSEKTALYKSTLVSGNTFADLTGGLGVDTYFIARHFRKAVYVERQTELSEIAAHNFDVLGLHDIEVINSDGCEVLELMTPVDLIYVDPARRNTYGNKIFAIADCDPNLIDINNMLLQKAEKVMVKLSPMLDLYAAMNQLKYVIDVHVVSHNNECKELLLLLGRQTHENPMIHCVNIMSDQFISFEFTREEEATAFCPYATTIRQYLYEPNASILKAGAFKTVATRYEIEKLHPNSHLYTSDKLISHFPGKVLDVIGKSSFNKKEIHHLTADLLKANISTRNFPLTAVELHKRLHLKEGGNDYLYATTAENGQHVVIRCRKHQF